MNNNSNKRAALEAHCKGVFSPASLLTVGDDAEYQEPSRRTREAEKGKQFLVPGPKSGRTPDTFFGLDGEHKHLYVAEGLPYADRTRFAESQPQKPGRGFLTSDFNRRGEFTDTIRSEQHRAQLKQEEKIQRRAEARLPPPTPPSPAAAEQAAAKEAARGFLYDRVYDSSSLYPEAKRLPRDTCNPTALGTERNLGPLSTSYSLAHRALPGQALERPQHARTAVIRDTFYERDWDSACLLP